MEKFYTITEGQLLDDYRKFIQSSKKLNTFVKEFFDEHGIEANEYSVSYYTLNLSIIPTEKDLQRFSKNLCKPGEHGIRKFKKSSKIQKDFISKLKSADFKLITRPRAADYFEVFLYPCKSEVIITTPDVDEMYLCLEAEDYIFEKIVKVPSYATEIKGSEYYKFKEDRKEGIR